MGNCAYTAAPTFNCHLTSVRRSHGKSGSQLRWHESLRQYSREKRHHLSLAAHRFYSTGYKAGPRTQTLSCISRSAGQASSFLRADAEQSLCPRPCESIGALPRLPRNARRFQECLPSTLTMRSSAARCTMTYCKPSPWDAALSTSGLGLVISRKMCAEAVPKSFERSSFRVWNGKEAVEVVSARDGS